MMGEVGCGNPGGLKKSLPLSLRGSIRRMRPSTLCAAMLKSVVDKEIDFFWRIIMLGVMEMVGWRGIRSRTPRCRGTARRALKRFGISALNPASPPYEVLVVLLTHEDCHREEAQSGDVAISNNNSIRPARFNMA
jgi:hypothetical protein